MSKPRRHFWEFAGFRLDRDEELVYRGEDLVPLPPRAIRTLTALVERAGQLVTKEELMKVVWPDTFVEEGNLSLNIHILRKALNGDGGPERFIETVPRRGYRFVAEVREPGGDPDPVVPAAPESSSPAAVQDVAEPGPPAAAAPARRTARWLVPVMVATVIAAGVSLVNLVRRASPASSLVRLTNHIATDRMPSVSPDGRHIAFATNRDGGKEQIYLMDSSGDDLRNLTRNTANNRKPVWSPDGRSIAFETDRRGSAEIFVMNADGGDPRPLASGGRPAWSPDGTRIAFRGTADGHPEIFVVDAAGGVPRRLTFDRGFCSDPTWSPDGARIAFTATGEHGLEIQAIRMDGTGRMVLAAGPGDNRLPAWFRDGRIAFTSNRNGHDAIFLMESDGTLQRQVTDGAFDEDEAAWWPDGRSLVFDSERDGNPEIYRLALPDSPDGAIRLTNNLAADESPAWSPDGKWIAFDSNRDGQPNIFLMDADGGHVRNLTRSQTADRRPAWSSDGRRIAFVSDRSGGTAIYAMNADGTAVERVSEGPNDDAPCWSPDGARIGFTRSGEIRLAAVGHGPSQPLVAGEECDWSPDGTRLVFARAGNGAREVYSIGLNGGDAVNLTRNGHGNGFPSWSRDGGHLTMNSNQDGAGFGIFVMHADGSHPRRLTSRGFFEQWPSWSPDGRWIAFASFRDNNWEIYKIAVPHDE